MVIGRAAPGLVSIAILGALLAGCGGTTNHANTKSQPPPQELAFPQAAGETLAQLRRSFGPGPTLKPAVSVLEPGRDRFGFGLFDRAQRQIIQAPAALYVAASLNSPVQGPFIARSESPGTERRFESTTVADGPRVARSVYAADLPFASTGSYGIIAVVRLDGRLIATEPVGVKVVRKRR